MHDGEPRRAARAGHPGPVGRRRALGARRWRASRDGISELAGLAPFAVDADGGRLDPGEVERAFRRSGAALLCLENTHTRAGGTVTDVARTEALAAAARRHGARVHLDGARLPNAAVALGVPLAALAAPVDTVALSLNKGLCAPFGALLAGDAATIAAARLHVRRLGGGTMHKAGIARRRRARRARRSSTASPRTTAARATLAGRSALDRARDEHRAHRAPGRGPARARRPAACSRSAPDGARVRLVTHRGIGDEDVERAPRDASIAADG